MPSSEKSDVLPNKGHTRIVSIEIPSDLRLGQAIANVMKSSMVTNEDIGDFEERLVYSGKLTTGKDLFYVSDDDLQTALLPKT